MDEFGLTHRQRILSRLVFYGAVLSGLWLAGRTVPDPVLAEELRWESAGVARPYVGVPVEEIETILLARETGEGRAE